MPLRAPFYVALLEQKNVLQRPDRQDPPHGEKVIEKF